MKKGRKTDQNQNERTSHQCTSEVANRVGTSPYEVTVVSLVEVDVETFASTMLRSFPGRVQSPK